MRSRGGEHRFDGNRFNGRGGGEGFAGFDEHGDGGIDLHALGAVGDEDFAEHALIDRLDLHGGLVGLDFGDDIAGADHIAFLFEPARQGALGHGRRQGRHQDVGGHGWEFPLIPL